MEEGTPPKEAELRAELTALRPRALQKRAEAAGVSEEDLDAVEDSAEIIELIVQKVAEKEAAAAAAAHVGIVLYCASATTTSLGNDYLFSDSGLFITPVIIHIQTPISLIFTWGIGSSPHTLILIRVMVMRNLGISLHTSVPSLLLLDANSQSNI